MSTVKVNVPLYIPSWLHKPLQRVKRAFFPPPPPPNKINIYGERHIEWTFISAEMPDGPGEAFEFGCEQGYLSLLAARKGFYVTALDLQPQNFLWCHPGVHFVQADLLKANLPQDQFDLIINCSSVEHVGLSGRYGINESATEGDLEVMRQLRRMLKPDGKLLTTMPCGRDLIAAPWHRVYGKKRLPHLLAGFGIEKEMYWAKDSENRWMQTSRDLALDFIPVFNSADPFECSYALAAFVLRKSGGVFLEGEKQC
jgi:SAM-dependent methyltransferase